MVRLVAVACCRGRGHVGIAVTLMLLSADILVCLSVMELT